MNEPLSGVVVVLDDAPFDELIGAIEVMVQEGLTTFAFHADTAELSTWVGMYSSRARIGVHGVYTSDQAQASVAAGASFIFAEVASPHLLSADLGVPVYGTAMTPTEIRQVRECGASGVQVFPADALGPQYAQALGALGLIDSCVPRYGLGAYAMQCWLTAGAPAVVVDSQLLGDALTGGDLAALRDRCPAFAALTTR